MYVLWSGKNQGWFTAAGNYSTDLSHAKRYDRYEALSVCARHKASAHQVLPVSLADIKAIV